MSDQFKKYVEEHRDDFDHLKPSPLVLDQLKHRLKAHQNVAKSTKTIRVGLYRTWLVAASIFIVLGVGYLILNQNTDKQQNNQLVQQKTESKESSTLMVTNSIDKQQVAKKEEFANHKKIPAFEKPNGVEPKKLDKHQDQILAQLRDSTSASSRLAAVLAIESRNQINNQVIAELTQTLNYDGNTNVRLAALNLLSKYAEDGYVAMKLQQAFDIQKDPFVQLGLINQLSQMKNVKIDDRLYALVKDPNTYSAVKDQAYQILLEQNKL